MADPYGSSESEDISSFLQILLQNSSSSVSTTDNSASAAASGLFGDLEAPNPRIFFGEETDGINPSTIVQSSFLSCEDSEASEIPTNPAALRSSKRSRAAEDHNLSEKRRRSRINEKLKALQRLIPNSNKTDKASMLDEAIEYLKQLQLQVQMLTMRNGLSSHPGYSLGSSQPMLFPPTRLELDEANVFRDTGTLSGENDVYIQGNMENNMNLIRSSTQPMLMPPIANNNSTSLRILPSMVPSVQNHYDTVSQFQLDMNNSSPGVSSS